MPDLRTMLVENALSVFDMDYLLDALIGSYFLSYTYLRILNMAFISETIIILVRTYIEVIARSDTAI